MALTEVQRLLGFSIEEQKNDSNPNGHKPVVIALKFRSEQQAQQWNGLSGNGKVTPVTKPIYSGGTTG